MKWFKHDSNANQDAKLQNVLLDYGLEGFGLYWYCIELISGNVEKDNLTFSLEHDARIIARNTGSSPQKIEEMMKKFIEYGLFENSTGVITCMKLARRLDKSMVSSPEMRAMIGSIKNHDPVMTQSGKPMQEENRIEENRIDRIVEFKRESFDIFWGKYPKKENKKGAVKKFSVLTKKMKTEDEIKNFTNMIINYALETFRDRDVKYWPGGCVYLNKELWNDGH